MEDEEGYFPCFHFSLNFREAGLKIVLKEELCLFLIFLTLLHNIPKYINFLLPIFVVLSIIKLFQIFSNLLIRLNIRANNIITKRNILKEIRFSKLIDNGQFHQLWIYPHHEWDFIFNPIPTLDLFGLSIKIGICWLDKKHQCCRSGKVVIVELPIFRH